MALLGSLFRTRGKSLPSVPDGTRLYAIGDIHGRCDLLDRLLAEIKSQAAGPVRKNILVFLGDYVDRGSASREVVDRVVNLVWPGWDIVALRGNHDQMVLEFLGNPAFYRAWSDCGGTETLISYGIRPPGFDRPDDYVRARDEFLEKLPPSHLAFLRALPYSHIVGDYIFVHAGVRPDFPLDRQKPEDLMWIRDEFLESHRLLGKVVVHGHTPSEAPVVRPNRIGVDTGAYATDCLTALVLEGEMRSFLSTAPANPAAGGQATAGTLPLGRSK